MQQQPRPPKLLFISELPSTATPPGHKCFSSEGSGHEWSKNVHLNLVIFKACAGFPRKDYVLCQGVSTLYCGFKLSTDNSYMETQFWTGRTARDFQNFHVSTTLKVLDFAPEVGIDPFLPVSTDGFPK